MRLGGPIYGEYEDPDGWVAALKSHGYTAAYCPAKAEADDNEIEAYVQAAAAADIVIAEVGAWQANPISPDDKTRREGIAYCQQQLVLADRIGARCCVNIAGSRGEGWSDIHPDNLSDATFDLIVESVREIIDGVKPTRTYYSVETMPYVFPDTVDNYLRLVEAVDRDRLCVHMDPVNLVSSPQRYYNTTALLEDFFAKLGPRIRCAHAKDTLIGGPLTVSFTEAVVGEGNLDYATYLRGLDKLDPDMPLLMEHMKKEEYPPAAAYIRSVAKEVGVVIK